MKKEDVFESVRFLNEQKKLFIEKEHVKSFNKIIKNIFSKYPRLKKYININTSNEITEEFNIGTGRDIILKPGYTIFYSTIPSNLADVARDAYKEVSKEISKYCKENKLHYFLWNYQMDGICDCILLTK